MIRTLAIRGLTLIFAALPLAASAQFQPMAMRLPAYAKEEVGIGPMSGAGPGDLLETRKGSTVPAATLHRYRDLVNSAAVPYSVPPQNLGYVVQTALARFDGATAPDLVWSQVSTIGGDLSISWGADVAAAPSPLVVYPGVWTYWLPRSIRALQVLPPPAPPLLAWTAGGGARQSFFGLLNLSGARASGTIATAPVIWDAGTPFFSADDEDATEDRIFPVRLSPAAMTGNVVDAVVPLMQGFRVLWNYGSTTLSHAALTQVSVGWADRLSYPPAGLFEPGLTVPNSSSCFGAGGLDVDGDGVRDVVFTMLEYTGVAFKPGQGRLLWVKNTGVAEDLAFQTPPPPASPVGVWHDLGKRADLQPLLNPGTLRELDLPGGPVLAIHDRGGDQILIVSGNGSTGFQVRRLPAFGAYVVELWVGDVVGGAAPDLLAWVKTVAGTYELWVYPDDLDLAPSLAWSPAPPTVAPVGVDLPLAVDVADVDSPFPTVTWIRPARPDTTGTTLTISGSELCTAGAHVDVTVRAMDDLGVYRQLEASVPVAQQPSLALVGVAPGATIVLQPGGFSGRATGEAWPRCGGSPVFTWGTLALSGLVMTPASSGPAAWLDFTIPEASYPGLLAGNAALTLHADDTAHSPTWAGTATLPLVPDARGLVDVSVAFDEAALAPGDVGLARVRLASRLGVPLPGVRAVVTLQNLSFAGRIVVVGAPSTDSEGGVVRIDPLPARDATVELQVPVRSSGLPGGVSVELYSGAFRLSPEASPPSGGATAVGCGCGTQGTGEALPIALALLLLGYMKPMRRVEARTRVTSSSTRITRQA